MIKKNVAFDDCERVLRDVLRKQLRIVDVSHDTNLIMCYPDFPQDEVLIDALEDLGVRCKEPIYDEWSGTFVELIMICMENAV